MTEATSGPSKKPLRGDTKALYDELVKALDSKANNLRPEEARKWFKDRIASAVKDRNRRVARSIPKVGELVTFLYDPKTKDELPYYDQFPLSFVVDVYDDGFLGISTHYLRPRDRLALYKRFLRLATDTTLKDTTRLRLTYRTLRDNKQYLLGKSCLKRYLYSHMLSVPTVVPATEWELTLGLPMAMFKKASAAEVYRREAAKRSR